MLIPRIIHHVWPGEDALRDESRELRATFLKHHPDWTMFFWRLADPVPRHAVRADVVEVLHDSRLTVTAKSDILRLWALSEYGGVYVDTDVECLKSFEPLLATPTHFFCGIEEKQMIGASVLGSEPGHPFVTRLLAEALRRLAYWGPSECNRRPHQITGPLLYTKLAEGRDDVTVHPKEAFYPVGWEAAKTHGALAFRGPFPKSYAVHRFHGTRRDGWTNVQRFSGSKR